ncbi:Uncharacterised protein [Pandoraea pulmonicola]|nr:Uncharacterised protein [Pandoraea pulmonicola]
MTSRDLDSEWSWALIDLTREGFADDLAALLNKHETVPPHVRHMLAGYLMGSVRMPERRGKTNSVLLPRERREVAEVLYALYHATEGVLVHSELLAEERRLEEIDIRRIVEGVRSRGIQAIAARYGVAESTVRQLHKARDVAAWAQVWAGARDLELGGAPVDIAVVTDFTGDQMLAKARQILDDPEAFDPFSE